MIFGLKQIQEALRAYGLEPRQVHAITALLIGTMPGDEPSLHEYAVSFTTSRQISEDRYEVFHPQKKCTDETTIGEIRQWYTQLLSGRSDGLIDNVVINQLQ